MSRRVIRLGDETSKKGHVIESGAPHVTLDGIPIALKGDRCDCHSDCRIAEGDPEHTIDGVPVAYEGHETTCGAVLIATGNAWIKG